MTTPKHGEFCFDAYDIIGFDLDGTLLRYNLNEMVPLEYELLRRYLVNHKGYSSALLDMTLNCDFLQKGLIIDADAGNLLKLSGDATILRATHGTIPLTTEQIAQKYGADRKWTLSSQFFQDPLSTWNGPISTKFRTLLDYFDIGAAIVFAQAVDVLDAECKEAGKAKPTTYKVWADVLEALICMYSREHFAGRSSAYFEALRAQPDRYLLRTDPRVLQWLCELRAAGKMLFLLTGSNIDFANFTSSYAMGAEWQQFFDCVICYAKKPGFFTSQRPYLRVEQLAEVAGSEMSLTELLPLNSTYSQGNWRQLQQSLARKAGKEPTKARSLYVGDNLIQDVYAPVTHKDLDAVFICEELLAGEGINTGEYEFHDVVSSSFWGSYFGVDGNATLWTSIISKHSKLCIPLVDTVAGTPLTHNFLTNKQLLNYFPAAPKYLTQKS